MKLSLLYNSPSLHIPISKKFNHRLQRINIFSSESSRPKTPRHLFSFKKTQNQIKLYKIEIKVKSESTA